MYVGRQLNLRPAQCLRRRTAAVLRCRRAEAALWKITLRRHRELTNPKILMGFSDVTSLHLYLYKLGHVMLYGGNLLCQFALSGPGMHDYTRECFLEAIQAMVGQKQTTLLSHPQDRLLVDVKASHEFQDGYLEWGDESNMGVSGVMEANPGLEWTGWAPDCHDVCGVLWGGCLDTLIGHLAIGHLNRMKHTFPEATASHPVC